MPAVANLQARAIAFEPSFQYSKHERHNIILIAVPTAIVDKD